jgi:hypothetical protein
MNEDPRSPGELPVAGITCSREMPWAGIPVLTNNVETKMKSGEEGVMGDDKDRHRFY